MILCSFFLVNTSQTPADTKSCIKARYTLGFLGFLGFALVYAMRVNLSVAIVSMVNQTAIPHTEDNDTSDVCPKTKPINGTFIPVCVFIVLLSQILSTSLVWFYFDIYVIFYIVIIYK